jgi:hypothetical protein
VGAVEVPDADRLKGDLNCEVTRDERSFFATGAVARDGVEEPAETSELDDGRRGEESNFRAELDALAEGEEICAADRAGPERATCACGCSGERNGVASFLFCNR